MWDDEVHIVDTEAKSVQEFLDGNRQDLCRVPVDRICVHLERRTGWPNAERRAVLAV